MLLRALEALTSVHGIEAIVVVAPPRFLTRTRNLVARAKSARRCKVISGGRSRQESVYNGLLAFDIPPEVVLIHDGARPLVSRRIVDGTILLSRKHKAVTAAIPVTDTLKRETRPGVLTGTVNRSGLWLAQTPQVFHYDLLLKAHRIARKKKNRATDDAGLIEEMGIPVKLFPGSQRNIKITTKADLAIAEMWLKSGKTD
jgi:2-C-methyl-D-erythritol 4-phosphate cytidylyltransferase